MVNKSLIIITSMQVIGDIACCMLSIICAYMNDRKYKIFFILNAISFLSIGVGDVYYNYFFRYLKKDIIESFNIIVIISMLSFQLSQIYNWFSIIKINKIGIFVADNLSYFLFSIILLTILIYYFIHSKIATNVTWYQIANILLNKVVWILAIICLSRSKTIGFTLLTLGCLLIASAAITADCLFMFEMNKLASATSIHIIWTLGVLVMTCGFFASLKHEFHFCPRHSIQARCCSWLSITSLTLILLIILLFEYLDHEIVLNMKSFLWCMPILLALLMILSVLSGNWFSKKYSGIEVLIHNSAYSI